MSCQPLEGHPILAGEWLYPVDGRAHLVERVTTLLSLNCYKQCPLSAGQFELLHFRRLCLCGDAHKEPKRKLRFTPLLTFIFDGPLRKKMIGSRKPLPVVASCDLPPPDRPLAMAYHRHAGRRCGTTVMRRWVTGRKPSRQTGICWHNPHPTLMSISASVGDGTNRRL